MGMRATRWLRASWRFVRVFWTLVPFVWAYLRDRRRFVVLGGARAVEPARRRRRADALLESLIALGPTFIKLGQLLSTRPDVLPPVYVEVLSQLQDDVPPAPWPGAKTVIERELGPVEERFDDLDHGAISGASLGQVYRGEVDGTPVAVKVKRPGVEGLVEADLLAIRWTLAMLLPFVDEARAFSVRNLADEFAKTIREEMDYRREAAMLEEIRGNFRGDASVVVPPVLDSHSGDHVLTMRYVGGTKITDVETLEERGIDRHAVAERLQLAYFQMIIEDGVFHADPHPGNLAVRDDGSIVFYDFGMSGRVDPYVGDRIVDFYVGVVNRDIDAILDALVAIGTLSPDADRDVMGEVMEIAIEDARGHQVEQYRVQEIVRQIEESIYEFPFRLPADLALILRVATVVEGVCVTLDPEYDFIDVASDFLVEKGYREEGVQRVLERTGEDLLAALSATVEIPPKLDDALTKVEHENFRVEANLLDDDRVLDRLAKRIILGILLGALTLSAAVLYAFDRPDGAVAALVALLVVVWLLIRSFRKRRGIKARPQFTRQNLYRRRDRE